MTHDTTANTTFGFWLYLLTDCILFGTFFATYLVLQNGTFGGPTPKEIFHLPYALTETLLLLGSSIACGLALTHTLKRTIFLWLAPSFLLAAVFVFLGFSELASLALSGKGPQVSAFLSAYFTLIGVHGLHVVVGLLLMLFFGLQLWQEGRTPRVLRRLTCLKMYWHFLYLIWIFTFAFVYLMGAK